MYYAKLSNILYPLSFGLRFISYQGWMYQSLGSNNSDLIAPAI